jgi:cytochrome c
MKLLSNRKASCTPLFSVLAATSVVVAAFAALSSSVQAQGNKMPEGDAERGEQQFEATCAECHGAAATAPTLRGIINRPIGSIESFYGYSEALKSLSSKKWTVENLDAYLKSPGDFAPGNLMYRDYPDAQMRADVIAFLATLPPPRN